MTHRIRSTRDLALSLVAATLATSAAAYALRLPTQNPTGASTSASPQLPTKVKTYEEAVDALEAAFNRLQADRKALNAVMARLKESSASPESYQSALVAYKAIEDNVAALDRLYESTKPIAEATDEASQKINLAFLLDAAQRAKADTESDPAVRSGLNGPQKQALSGYDASFGKLITAIDAGAATWSDEIRSKLGAAVKPLADRLDAAAARVTSVELDAGWSPIAPKTENERITEGDVGTKRASLRDSVEKLAALVAAYDELLRGSKPGKTIQKPWLGKNPKDDNNFLTLDPSVLKRGMETKIGPYLSGTDADKALAKRLENLAKAEADLAKGLVSRVSDAILARNGDTNPVTAADATSTRDLRRILQATSDILSRGASDASGNLKLGEVGFDAGIARQEQSLRASLESRGTFTALVDPTLGQDAQAWVADYIRLFYFTDVKRMLLTLNPNTHVANPDDASFGEAADKAARELGETEDRVTLLLGSVNELAEQLGGLEDKLDQARRTAAAKARQLARAMEAQERYTTVDERLKQIEDKAQTPTTGELPDALAARTASQAEIERLQPKEKDKTITDAERQDLRQARAEHAAAVRLVDALRNEQTRLKAQKARDAARADVAQRAVDDAQRAKDDADAKQTQAEDATSGVQAQLAKVKEELIAKRQELNGKRLAARRTALDEARAFAKARDNAPFYVSPPGGNETDPARRVVMYGFGDSNTIVIRGNPRDVEAAKELIAQYDRPAPQARVTLYTLQVNGSTSVKSTWLNRKAPKNPIDEAFSDVKDELRDLRAATGMVQETLRQAITKEIARAASLADKATARRGRDHGPFYDVTRSENSRLLRYFFYAPEVRKQLGFDWDESNLSLNLARQYLGDDVRTLADCLERGSRRETKPEERFYLGLVGNSALLRLQQSKDRYGLDKIVAHPEGLIEAIFGIEKQGQPAIDGAEETIRKFLSHPEQVSKNDWALSTLIDREKTKLLDSDVRSPSPENLRDYEYLTRWTLPDPARVTTLGEMMFVLSLASKQSRERVIQTFADEIHLNFHVDAAPPKDLKRREKGVGRAQWVWRQRLKNAFRPGNTSLYPQFLPTLLNSLQTRLKTDPTSNEVSSNQLEILQAVEAKARETVANEVQATIRAIDDRTPLPKYGTNLLNRDLQITGTSALADNLRDRYRPLVAWLARRLSQEAGELVKGEPTLAEAAEAFLKASGTNAGDESRRQDARQGDLRAWELAQIVNERYGLALARPRVAAADDMIKRMIIATEDDLDFFFVTPTLEEIRNDVRAQGVELGMLEKQSILATNRQVARLSTNANANATLAGAVDLRDEASQLAAIAGASKANSITPGLTTGAVGFAASKLGGKTTSDAFGTAGLVGLLDILSSQDAEPRGEVYSINSNGVFQITPIFDPSGQALQFKFDHVAQGYIQGPDGTSTRDLSRIERVTVNNTVQLTNLEVREVASYGLDAKVGTPDTRRGGIPVLRDLPVIRDIPLLGYYSRRNAAAATRQESLVFAQTSLYPTVGDVVGLLLDVNVPPTVDRTLPQYLYRFKNGYDTTKPTPSQAVESAVDRFTADLIGWDKAALEAGTTIELVVKDSTQPVTLTLDKSQFLKGGPFLKGLRSPEAPQINIAEGRAQATLIFRQGSTSEDVKVLIDLLREGETWRVSKIVKSKVAKKMTVSKPQATKRTVPLKPNATKPAAKKTGAPR